MKPKYQPCSIKGLKVLWKKKTDSDSINLGTKSFPTTTEMTKDLVSATQVSLQREQNRNRNGNTYFDFISTISQNLWHLCQNKIIRKIYTYVELYRAQQPHVVQLYASIISYGRFTNTTNTHIMRLKNYIDLLWKVRLIKIS